MQLKDLQNTILPILILGETGTGKSHLAKEIACSSSRFLQLNIASLNSNVFESELFGHVKGAFSGALNNREGFCERIGEGSLFIDEIGELSLEMQTKILTLLDERIFYPVGSSTPKEFKGRLIFATNRDLQQMVFDGEFREDLFYRLRLIMQELTPLREEPSLFQIILEVINNMRLKYKRHVLFKDDALELLASYDWPGNYRELNNTIEVLFLENKLKISKSDLPNWVKKETIRINSRSELPSYYNAIEIFEREFFYTLLERNQGKINQSAQVSGISKVTLISKLKKYGINRKEFKTNLNISAVS